MQYNIYWGDMHCNIHRRHMRNLERTFEATQEALDFFPIAYYPADFYEMMEGLRVESQGPRESFERDWERVLELVRCYNAPGEFITFPGYEWTGNRTRYGDHNIFYFDEGPLDLSENIEELFANLRRRRAIAIPHHTGYQVGQRGKDWNSHDEELSPFVEIFSSHGSSEGCDTPFSLVSNGSMGPRVSGGTVQDGLRRGYRLGIIASNDSHNGVAGVWGTGLMAALAPDLTREALWEAFMARRVYGVTGDRIQLDFTIKGSPMGSEVRTEGPPRLRAAVVASQALDRIELLRNNRVLYTYCHSGTWDVPPGDRLVRAKIKVECGWGPAPVYGLVVEPKRWEGELTLADGRLLSVEPCFTYWGQKVGPLEERGCCWSLTTAQRRQAARRESQQALIFEVETPPQALMTLRVNGREESFTLAEAMAGSRVIGFLDETKALVRERFLLKPEEIENPDVFWHNAYKVKIHTAVPQAGYTAALEWVDDDMPPGRNWYYLRVSELNGQMAWSSPIWVECG